eukprot:1143929-Pelagomonas_calceolata.AAC.2
MKGMWCGHVLQDWGQALGGPGGMLQLSLCVMGQNVDIGTFPSTPLEALYLLAWEVAMYPVRNHWQKDVIFAHVKGGKEVKRAIICCQIKKMVTLGMTFSQVVWLIGLWLVSAGQK